MKRNPLTAAGPARCRRKFLRFFPKGFRDETYLAWERDYKWETHQRWEEALNQREFSRLLAEGKYTEIAARAVRTEQRSQHSMIFSFEKMALRDAVKATAGARAFASGLYEFLHGRGSEETKFTRWCETVAALPRRQTRVLTWPLVTVFGFIAQPDRHIFLKPTVTKIAAEKYGFDFAYQSKPNWETYASLLEFADTDSARCARPQATRHDRPAILHLGARLRRIHLVRWTAGGGMPRAEGTSWARPQTNLF